jgi:hypothetical protein
MKTYAFKVISCSVLIIMGNVTEVLEKTKTHILSVITFFLNCAFCELMWRNIVKPDWVQIMRTACWMTKATDTLRICNTYCCLMATMVAGTCLIVMFISLHSLSCLIPKFLFKNIIAVGSVHVNLVYSQLSLMVQPQ